MFLDSTKDIDDVESLLNAVAKHLHGNSSMYFVARYEHAMNSLDELINQTAMASGVIDSNQLVAVARAKSVITANRRIDEMRAHLLALRRYIPADTSNKLRKLIDLIEQDISMDRARDRMGRN